MAKKEENRYKYMENALKDINARCISLNNNEKKRNNIILNEVLNQVTRKMRENDNLFDKLHRNLYYGGSYYNGLKISKPNDYDIDLLLHLPTPTRPKVSPSHIPGYVQIHLKNLTEYQKQKHAIRELSSQLLDDDNYLSIDKTQRWIESVFHKALSEFPDAPEKPGFTKKISTKEYGICYCELFKGDPAFTLKLAAIVNAKNVNMDVDLVPCFVFTDEQWPGHPYRPNPAKQKNEFVVVPNKADPSNTGDLSKYWRMSFQDQERFLIKNLQNLKPALRFLKRLRDVEKHEFISSYSIKTIFLWERDERHASFWYKPVSYIFMEMLKKYKEFIEKGKIPYYWNEGNNLMQKPKDPFWYFAKRIQRIIDDLEKHPEDSSRITKYMGLGLSNNIVPLKPKIIGGFENPTSSVTERLQLNVVIKATFSEKGKSSENVLCELQ